MAGTVLAPQYVGSDGIGPVLSSLKRRSIGENGDGRDRRTPRLPVPHPSESSGATVTDTTPIPSCQCIRHPAPDRMHRRPRSCTTERLTLSLVHSSLPALPMPRGGSQRSGDQRRASLHLSTSAMRVKRSEGQPSGPPRRIGFGRRLRILRRSQPPLPPPQWRTPGEAAHAA